MEKRKIIVLVTGVTILSIAGIITYVVIRGNQIKKMEAQLAANVRAELEKQAAAAKLSAAKKKSLLQKLVDVDWSKVSNVANTISEKLKTDE